MSVTLLWNKVISWSEGFIRKLSDKAYRDAYLADHVRTGIAFQIRALREQAGRGWNQTQLGERMGKPQSVVSRLEDTDYGKVTLQTLLQVAAAFDVAILVQFVEWEDWLIRMEDVSPSALQKESFNADRLRALSARQHIPFQRFESADVPWSAYVNLLQPISLLTQFTAGGTIGTIQAPHHSVAADEPEDDLEIELPIKIVQWMEAGHG
jgi:transcriptional regulator with XRE-family HTH domain